MAGGTGTGGFFSDCEISPTASGFFLRLRCLINICILASASGGRQRVSGIDKLRTENCSFRFQVYCDRKRARRVPVRSNIEFGEDCQQKGPFSAGADVSEKQQFESRSLAGTPSKGSRRNRLIILARPKLEIRISKS